MGRLLTKALIVGAGSIGTRHARVLTELGHDVAIVTARDDLAVRAFRDLREAVGSFDPSYVVIANETALHATAVQELSQCGYAATVLIEKPLAIDPDAFGPAPFARVGVGFNLRFHPVITRLAEVLAGQKVHTIEVYAGQDLASWRPGRKLADQYSTSRAQGGGVLRDLSHELDYLGWLFGECHGVFARGGRLTDVTRDSDDAWGIVARYERSPIATIQLNYLDTQKRRRIVVNSTAGTIEADLIAATLRINDSLEAFDVDSDTTYRELHKAMLNPGATVPTVPEALETDRVITMIEQSAAQATWIER